MSDERPTAENDAGVSMSLSKGHTAENDALRLCCCHGHLDGLALDEMAAIGAPCPTAAYVRERMAEAYDDGYDACVSDGTPQLHNGNPYRDDDVDPRVIPPGSSEETP